ncbi:protein-disulfide reductase DsbD family protein [Gimesia panareensis]|uniref:protein-disulfide reductase DsbD family protein n=1 Tax=Gimesia panareensis TaxID=2527978 RepID=UPI00118B86A2|nr:protein-disulfide reductase DsbD family protein [Gimesia panareensis]QDU51281.1 hypothetical protein Pan110_36450 [Gimesia panareensis]
MSDFTTNTESVFRTCLLPSVLWSACILITVSGCEKSELPEATPEKSADAKLPQEEISPLPSDQQTQQAKNLDRSEGEQVTVILEVPDQPVKAGASFPLTVKFEIAPLWEIRTLDAQPAKVATQLNLDLPDGFQAAGDWQAPPSGRSLSLDSHPVYAGEAEFRQTVQVDAEVKPGEYTLSCQVQYQACDEQRCLSPVQKKLQVTVLVRESRETD